MLAVTGVSVMAVSVLATLMDPREQEVDSDRAGVKVSGQWWISADTQTARQRWVDIFVFCTRPV